MLTEEKRRRIAREFLEKYFGKNGHVLALIEGKYYPVPRAFELWKNYKSSSRAFDLWCPPYVTTSTNPVIAVSDSKEELMEITNLIVPEDRRKAGLPEFDTYKGYYIMYD